MSIEAFARIAFRQLPPIAVFRAALYLLGRKAPATDGPWTVGTLSGALYTSSSNGDLVQDMVRMCGFWDWKSLALATLFCKPGDGIVEVGAHAGTETVGFARIVGPSGRVTAFEPGAAPFATLEKNVLLNKFEHVTLRRSAVGDRSGYATFVAADSRNSGSSFITEDAVDNGDTVPITTIDDIESQIGRATMLFIDVEGLRFEC